MKNLSKLDHLEITVECRPKTGREDKIHAAIVAAIQKHAKAIGWTVKTEYVYEDHKELT